MIRLSRSAMRHSNWTPTPPRRTSGSGSLMWPGQLGNRRSRHCRKLLSFRGALQSPLPASARHMRRLGFAEDARNILRELIGKAHVTAYFVSRIHAALGESNEAIDWLEIAYKQHGEWMALLKIDPRFDSLRDDARFQDLMRRMN